MGVAWPGRPRPPERWLSELAEELAAVAALQSPQAAAAIGDRIRAVAAERGLEGGHLVNLVAREWDRLGIARVPRQIAVGG